MYIQRIITSWCAAALIFLVTAPGSFTLKSFAGRVPLLYAVGVAVAVYLLLMLAGKHIKRINTDHWAMAAVMLVYAALLLRKHDDFYFYLGVMVVITAAGSYIMRGDGLGLDKIKISASSAVIITAVAAVWSAFFIGSVTTLRYLTYGAPNFDFGIFVNMFHNMKNTLLPMVTCERDGLISHFAVHLSPIYYLILPVYWLFPFPATLQISQAVIAVSGVIPLFLLTKHKGFSGRTGAAVCVAYCFYPALSGGCFYDLHENCFLAPLLLWFFYFYETKRFAGVYSFALLTMLVKEDAPVYIAFAALFILLHERDYKHGGILFVFSVVYFLGAVYYLNNFGLGIMSTRYVNYTSKSGGLLSIFLTLFRNPAFAISEIMTAEKFIFMLKMLVPLGFLPLATKKVSRLTLILPMVLINLMPNYIYQHSIYYQYTFGTASFLFYATVLNLADMTHQFKRSLLSLAVVASFLMYIPAVYRKVEYFERYRVNLYEIQLLNECLESIPKDASVQATTFLVPKLAQRDIIYEAESKHETEYAVIDLRYQDSEYADLMIELYEMDGYQLIEYHDFTVMVLRKSPQT